MKIFIPQRAKEGDIGGGFSFTRDFIKTTKDKVEFVNNLTEADIYFIPGPTLAEKSEVELAKTLNKKIVLRIDNITRNSRNRNTGTSRLLKYAQMSDLVIYQSQWAKDFIMPFVKKDGPIIYNGIDVSIFKKVGDVLSKEGSPQCLYVRSSRDETKRWEKAWYNFQKLYFKNKDAHLWIVGKFGPENLEYNFDLFGGAEKRYRFLGEIKDRNEMAKIYRSADLIFIPFSNEACSNTFAEAKACGTNIIFEEDAGGIIEQDKIGIISLESMSDKYLEEFNKICQK